MVKGKGLWVLAVALAAVLLVTACAPAPTVPVGEKKVVQIGRLTPLTGGGGAAEQPSFQGSLDYMRYFNEEKGVPLKSVP